MITGEILKINKLSIILVFVAILVIASWSSDEREKTSLTDNDFDNDDEGAIMFWTDIAIQKENPGKDYLLFFASERINGLRIIYDFRDWKLKAGIPLLSSEKEVDFDGKLHHIAYTFRKNDKQLLYFDGNPVDEGLFSAKEIVPLTGLVVYDGKEVISASYDVGVYDRALSGKEIKDMFNQQ